VIHVVGQPVHIDTHGIPEIPDKVQNMIVGYAGIVRKPGKDIAIRIGFYFMKYQEPIVGLVIIDGLSD
jgi:hypothetical protein